VIDDALEPPAPVPRFLPDPLASTQEIVDHGEDDGVDDRDTRHGTEAFA
jgi:hypothetical protein